MDSSTASPELWVLGAEMGSVRCDFSLHLISLLSSVLQSSFLLRAGTGDPHFCKYMQTPLAQLVLLRVKTEEAHRVRREISDVIFLRPTFLI